MSTDVRGTNTPDTPSASHALRPSGRRKGANGMQTLLIGIGIYAAIWIIVLWGARYFGPRGA